MATATKQAAPTDDGLRELLQVQPPDAVVEYINLLLYGESGIGKTYFTGTADDDPRLRPLCIFDVEGGMMTLRNKPGIDVIRVRSVKEVQNKYNAIYRSIKEGKLYYKTFGIDSLTELADLDMKDEMKIAYERNPEKVNIDVPSPREWGIVRNHIRMIVRAFRDLPAHIVFTASLGIDQKPESKEPPKYRPGFAGKLQREVPGFADIVGYYRAASDGLGGNVRRLQVVGTERVVAKDRTSVLGDYIDNPTLGSIWDIIEGVELPKEPELETGD